jgi:hypothetical protein
MRINYLTFNDTIDIIYSKPLESGKSYTLQVNFMWARGGSADRITWDNNSGRYAITRDPTDAGLYFKFGSVVGLFNDVDAVSGKGKILTLPGRTNVVDTFFVSTRDIAWDPLPGAISSWGDVPAYVLGDLPKTVTPEDSYHTIANVKAGKGDPCRLVGMDLNYIKTTSEGSLTYADIDNGRWRLPTLQDNIWFVDDADPYLGLHFWDLAGGTYPSPFGPGVAGGEFPKRISGVFSEGRKAKFLPAVGCRRNSNGNVARVTQSTIGYYWSNESIDNGPSNHYGNFFMFYSGGVGLYNNDLRPFTDDFEWGYSVRCIRQTLTIEVGVDPWEDGGELNINGEGNVKI